MLINNKKQLREYYKLIRNSICGEARTQANSLIFNHFINSDLLSDFDVFLCYVSVNSEADTIQILNYLLKCKKKVAVPYCCGSEMDFYEIDSIDDLIGGAYGIPTVDIGNHKKIEDFSNALCIVPALSFDLNGNRLGYGGGYYDRFLSKNNVRTLGIDYDKCLTNNLPFEEHDKTVDMILTDKGFRPIIKEANTYE